MSTGELRSTVKAPSRPLSRRQVDIILSRSTAAISLVFALQSAPTFLAQSSESVPMWQAVVVPSILASIVVSLIASITTRWVRVGHGLVAFVYVVVLASWPYAVVHPIAPTENHWLYYLLTVATGNAALAFGVRLATLYTFAVPAMYGFLRWLPPASTPLDRVTLDVMYSIILGGAVLIIEVMLRQAAAGVDQAQATAMESYAVAVRHHAKEAERVQVDAIVHDSVLTTLLSAARAYGPDAKALAGTMAGNAIGYLRDAAEAPLDRVEDVALQAVAARIRGAADDVGARFEVRIEDPRDGRVPAAVGETLVAAATQAMVNSAQHAGEGARRWLNVAPAGDGLRIEVGDDGRGFELGGIATARLGVRVSILERVTAAGGSAEIDSTPGAGTVVSIRWPDGAGLPERAEHEQSFA